MPAFNPVPSSIQINRMLRRPPGVGGISFNSGVTQHPLPLIQHPHSLPLKRAFGGSIPDHPSTPVIGAINTSTPGRADAHPTHVPPGSYVMSAEDVAHLGSGNTASGQELLGKMFLPLQAQSGKQVSMMGQNAPYGGTGAPFGAQMPDMATKRMGPPSAPRGVGPAHGGVVPQGGGQPGTPINISGGEFVIRPDEVKRAGRGDINYGHEVLDAWVKSLRDEHIKTLKQLPGPAK